jgi:hypothetical protein
MKRLLFLALLLASPAWGAGLVCDGVTDESAYFASLAATIPRGGELTLPSGRCLVKNWNLTTSGLTVRGQGAGYPGAPGATVLQSPNGVGDGDTVLAISALHGDNIHIEHLSVYPLAPNGDRAGRGIVSVGTRPVLEDVTVFSGTLLAVDFTGTDSADAGGIFRSVFYGGGSLGTLRLSGATINVVDSYINCNSNPTAISIRGIAPTSASSVNTRGLLIELCETPVIDAGDAATGGVAFWNDFGSRITNVSGTGDIVRLGDSKNGGNFSLLGTEINGSGQARAIHVNHASGNVHIFPSRISGTFTGGAAILLPDGTYGEWDVRDPSGVEYLGYRGTEFLWHHFGIHPSGYALGQGRMTGLTLATTGAVPTPIFGLPLLQPDMIHTVHASVTGKRNPTGAFLYERNGAFMRDASGKSSQVGYVVHSTTVESDPAAGVGLVLTGNEVQVQVKGTDATPFDWLADVEWVVR